MSTGSWWLDQRVRTGSVKLLLSVGDRLLEPHRWAPVSRWRYQLGAPVLATPAHGLSEIVYAFTSGANSNGSAFAGLTGDTTFNNTALGVTMLIGRYLPVIFVLALAGSLAQQHHGAVTTGTLPTHRPLFITLVTDATLVLTALTFIPALALGPLAEGLHPMHVAALKAGTGDD